MTVIKLEPANHDHVHALLCDETWVVACLCAAWCDVCNHFREQFETIAAACPDVLMLWIDIEDEPDVVATFDVDNFPTLLIQRGNQVAFYGLVEADTGNLLRLIRQRMETDNPGKVSGLLERYNLRRALIMDGTDTSAGFGT